MFQIIEYKQLGNDPNIKVALIRFDESGKYQAYIGFGSTEKRIINKSPAVIEPNDENYELDDPSFYELTDEQIEEKNKAKEEWASNRVNDQAYEVMEEESQAVNPVPIIASGNKMSYPSAKYYFPKTITEENLYDADTILITYNEDMPGEYMTKLFSIEGMQACMSEISKITRHTEWDCFCLLVRENHIKLKSNFKLMDQADILFQSASMSNYESPVFHRGYYMGNESRPIIVGDKISECVSEFDKTACLEWANQIYIESHKVIDLEEIPFKLY